MSASSSNTIDIVSVTDGYAFDPTGQRFHVRTLTRQNLLKAAKVAFPSVNGRDLFRVPSAEIVTAILSDSLSVIDSALAKSTDRQTHEVPTDKQARYLKALGHVDPVATKREAAELIERLSADKRAETPTESTTAPITAPTSAGSVESAIRDLVSKLAPAPVTVDEDKVREIVASEIGKQAFPTTLEVKIGATTHKVDGRTHKVFPKVLAYAARGYHVLLVGPAGSGKSTIAEQVHAALGHDAPLPSISFGPTTPTSKLFGYNDATGRYNGTPFRQAYEDGTPFLGDELDNGHPGLVAELNQSLANRSAAFADGQVPRGDGFVFIGTANTYGRGGDRLFVGRNQLDAATLDRFKTVTVDYDEDLETAVALSRVTEDKRAEAVRFIGTVRRHRNNVFRAKLPVIVSPRSVIDGVDLVCNLGIDHDEVIEDLYLGGLSVEIRAKVTA